MVKMLLLPAVDRAPTQGHERAGVPVYGMAQEEINMVEGYAMIRELERVPLREVWQHEALDFTTWLERNVDVLNDALDITLSGPEREQSAGAFSADLVAEDEAGSPVVIENQLGKSDHDDLGKV